MTETELYLCHWPSLGFLVTLTEAQDHVGAKNSKAEMLGSGAKRHFLQPSSCDYDRKWEWEWGGRGDSLLSSEVGSIGPGMESEERGSRDCGLGWGVSN